MLQIPALIWLLIGFLFILVEIFTPSLVFVFFGTSALITGVAVALGLPHTYGFPFVLFTVLTMVQVTFLRSVFKRWFAGGEVGSLGEREDEEFTGREVEVVSGFEAGNGRGTVSFRGSNWSAVSDQPLSPGEVALIQGREGLTLTIVKIKQTTE